MFWLCLKFLHLKYLNLSASICLSLFGSYYLQFHLETCSPFNKLVTIFLNLYFYILGLIVKGINIVDTLTSSNFTWCFTLAAASSLTETTTSVCIANVPSTNVKGKAKFCLKYFQQHNGKAELPFLCFHLLTICMFIMESWTVQSQVKRLSFSFPDIST